MKKIGSGLSLIALLGMLQVPTSALAQINENELAFGKNARQGKTQIQLNLPAQFNYKTRAEILGMRSREVAKYPNLLKGSYVPFNPIWGAIEDGKPWWGLAGAGVYDSGAQSMLGFAEESRFIMNPYLLVAANPAATNIWHRSLITKKQIDDPGFPFFWLPESLVIDPQRPLGTVVYNISNWRDRCLKSGFLANASYIKKFSLVAYNARDFGYKYIFFNQEKSIGVVNDNPADEPVFIKQFIHCGGTCGCPGSCCNNMSPFIEEIDRLRITKLPARAVVYLWKEEPGEKQNPDLVFLLEFR